MPARPAGSAVALAPVIAGVLAALLMAARLLLPVPVGMANNGDAVRLMCQRIFAGGAGPYLTFRNTNLDTNLGSYPIDSGHAPRSQECRDCLLMDVSREMRWTGLAGVLAYWTACLAGAGLLVRRSRRGDRRRAFALVTLVLIGCTVIQYVTAVYGEGNEIIKHMLIALFTSSIAPHLAAGRRAIQGWATAGLR